MPPRDIDTPMTASIPADVERPDKIAFGLTARQLGIATAAAVLLWALYSATRDLVPVPVFLGLALPVVGVTAALVLGRRDGLGLDQLAVAATRFLRAPRRLVPTMDDVSGAMPAWIAADAGPLPAPLRLPAESISTTGVVDLGRDGVALICACSTVNFSLRTAAEQNALVSTFAAWLNGLAGAVQVVVRADRVNLRPHIEEIERQAGGLPHPALESAAREYLDFLNNLTQSRDLLCRKVLLVLREPVTRDRDTAARAILRRADEAARALAAAEITLSPLDGHAATAFLRAACDPHGQPAEEVNRR